MCYKETEKQMKETNVYEGEEYSGSKEKNCFKVFKISTLGIGKQDESHISK